MQNSQMLNSWQLIHDTKLMLDFFIGIINTRSPLYTRSTSFIFLHAINIFNKFIMMIRDYIICFVMKIISTYWI